MMREMVLFYTQKKRKVHFTFAFLKQLITLLTTTGDIPDEK